jgi:hypothetical protein
MVRSCLRDRGDVRWRLVDELVMCILMVRRGYDVGITEVRARIRSVGISDIVAVICVYVLRGLGNPQVQVICHVERHSI